MGFGWAVVIVKAAVAELLNETADVRGEMQCFPGRNDIPHHRPVFTLLCDGELLQRHIRHEQALYSPFNNELPESIRIAAGFL